MKTKERLSMSFSWAKINSKKVLSSILILSVITFFACEEESEPDLKIEETVSENNTSIELQELFSNENTERLTDGVLGAGGNPTAPGCIVGVRAKDYSGTPSVASVPFYNNTVLNETGRANGSCDFPNELNKPCRYTGSFTINNNPGMSGNYRIVTQNGGQFSLGTITSSLTFVYGRPERPYVVYCGHVGIYTVEAENPLSPGTWIKVFEIKFICTNCNFSPVGL